jgi:CubicO group peptidase (beta-lactamase class C family)
MHRQVDEGTLPGIVGMLVRHGKIVDVDVYGMRNIASSTPMTRDTIFRLYSQTKPVTSVALLILYDENKWELDDPITNFIPEFSNLQVYAGTDQDGLPVLEPMHRPPTIRELMSHAAGFAYGLGQDNYADAQFYEKVWSNGIVAPKDLSDLVTKVAHVPLLYQPGTDWDYSASDDIIGAVVERISVCRSLIF